MVATVVVGKIAEWSEGDREDYLAHNNEVPLLSVHNDQELDRALAKVNELIDCPALSVGSERYLDALSDLVSVYEARTVHFPRASGVAILRHLMEERGLRQKDLIALFGSKSVVSEVLSGKRRLALRHIVKLGEYFGLPTSVFIDPPTVAGGGGTGDE